MNLFIAFLPGIAWGLLPVVTVFLKGDIKKQILGIGFGACFLATIISMKRGFFFDGVTIFVGLMTGIFWSIGFLYQLKAINIIGVSKTSPISNGSQLILTTLFSVFFFKEWVTVSQICFGTLAIFLIALGMKISSYTEDKNSYSKNENIKAMKNITISTMSFLIYLVSTKLFKVDSFGIIFPQSLGIAIGGLAFVGIKNIKFQINISFLKYFIPGFMWFIGNICLLMSYEKFGVAISFGLAQTNILISTISSIIILKEYKTKKEFKYIVIGLVIIAIGLILLTKIK